MSDLDKSYSVEVDTVDKDTWYKTINNFNDANIYQTWAHDEIRFGRKRMSHLVVKKDGKLVAAVQVRILKIPVINAGIAYIFWGPLWKLKGKNTNIDNFRHAIRALKTEYAERRGLLLRIYPVLFSDESDIFLPILRNEGFSRLGTQDIGRTLLIDLSPDLDTLRKRLDSKWRNHLNRAIRNNLELLEGSSDEMFEMFNGLYKELKGRKQFVESIDINEFRLIQKDLPVHCKMKIILCRFEGCLCAGGIFSTIGTTGLTLFRAINEIGMKSNGSYLVQWRYLEWLKENQFASYDLHGINPVANPGTYEYKAGLSGKNGKDVYFLGKLEVCENKLSEIAVKYGELILSNLKKAKAAVHDFRNTLPRHLKRT